jgi:hypothetical protein
MIPTVKTQPEPQFGEAQVKFARRRFLQENLIAQGIFFPFTDRNGPSRLCFLRRFEFYPNGNDLA